MTGPVYEEDHQITDFKIFDKPDVFSNDLLKNVKTHLGKSEKLSVVRDESQNKDFLLFTVTINATNKLNDKELSKIQVTSNYLVEYNKLEQMQIDMACDLVERSVQHCYNFYFDKVNDTYLENDRISIPKNLKEDCIKQKIEFTKKN